MPILHCDFGGGLVIDALVHDSLIPRIANGALLPGIPLDKWDAMPRAERNRMRRDFELLSDVLTKAKIGGRQLRLGRLRRTIGTIRGNQ